MKKNKININRPPISRQEIDSHKDFNKILYKHSQMKKPLYKRPRFLSSIIVVATIILVIMLNKEEEVQSPYINPPIAEFDIAYDDYAVDAAEGGYFTHHGGSIINFPPNSFVDENGNPVIGKVDIKYREFHEPVDIFLAGIPMAYDSAGTQYHFETAGMMDIRGFQNGKPVFFAEGKNAEVALASFNPGPEFNLYELDTVNRNWAFRGKDDILEDLAEPGLAPEVSEINESETLSLLDRLVPETGAESELSGLSSPKAKEIALREVKKEIVILEKIKPIAPKKADLERHSMNIHVDQKDFPEIAVYKDVVFEIGAENKNFNPENASIVWHDVSLAEVQPGVKYKVTFSKGETSVSYIVYPVFKGKSYDVAKKEFEAKYAEHGKQLGLKKAEEKRLQDELALAKKKSEEEAFHQEKLHKAYENRLRLDSAAFAKEQEARNKKQEKIYQLVAEQRARENERLRKEHEARLKLQEVRLEQENRELDNELDRGAFSQNTIRRVFTINNFGVWNCDAPQNLPSGAILAASFSKPGNQKLQLSQVCLVDDSRKAMYTYYPQVYSNFKFNPEVRNVIWASTNDGKLVIYKPEDFAKIPAGATSHDFEMEVIDPKKVNAAELKKRLMI
ncbi:MAG: hypothetical protein H0X62_02865 [Bacteroidetes bacterium]|nr:hypothetical protein [Bacteroidota bacterium]